MTDETTECDYGQCNEPAEEIVKVADPFGDMTMRACETHAEHGIENRQQQNRGGADD